MNSDVSYEVSCDGNCETKNDQKLNRNSELKTNTNWIFINNPIWSF